jgi:cytosine/adenosine deaminase-related metal-dependent hydrolase
MVRKYIIRAQKIITDPRLREKGITSGAILVEGSEIAKVGPYEILKKEHPGGPILGSDHHLALPGFIDAHNHGQGLTTFSQGLADDKLELWSVKWPRIFDKPAELTYLDAFLAAARQIRSGVTSTMPKRMDSPPLPLPEYRLEVEKFIQAYQEVGIRLRFAIGTTDKSSHLVYDDQKEFLEALPRQAEQAAREFLTPADRISLQECLGLIQELHETYLESDMISLAVAITGPQWLSDKFLLPLAEKSQELDIPLHGPILETVHQKLYAQKNLGETVIQHFDNHDLLGEHFSCAHGVWFTEEDMRLFLEHNSTLIHCPSSNLRFHGGIAPVKKMLELGMNVALAVDSQGINDDDDTFQEMRLANLLHQLPGPGRSPDAWDLLAMATVNGARALGLEDKVGTLEVGKKADLLLIDLDDLHYPCVAPDVPLIRTLLKRGKPELVDLVMVDGRPIYQDGSFLRFDLDEMYDRLDRVMDRVDWQGTHKKQALAQEVLPYIRKYYAEWTPQDIHPWYICNARD